LPPGSPGDLTGGNDDVEERESDVIWAILAFLGVPLWFCAIAIATLVWRNRSLRHRAGNMPVRVLREGEKRWHRGHALWVHDVFAFRGSPAAWEELLVPVIAATAHSATDDERAQLHRLDEPVVMTLLTDSRETIKVAGAAELREVLPGPFAAPRGPA
jgi:hypothetical protein